ncbi:MAG: type II secretion system protein [Kiritimatiellia bacterium]|nr:type II secretion system protein [Kiritimatiellia bacterium]
MKRTPLKSRTGFTLIEVMGAMLILGIALALTLTSFFSVSQSEKSGASQGEIDIDARLLIERLRRDLWLTSRDEIVLYPAGNGPFTAISFPVVYSRTSGSPVPRNLDGSIAWDATVIYHLWEGPPAEVRRTVFSPRTTLTEAARLQQLEETVAQGQGGGTHNGQNASTRRMISNLVDWRLNVSGPTFDGYSQTPGRRAASLGSAMLTDGNHDFTFRVSGKNSRSSSHRIGVDWISASPSGSPREGEAQTISASSGATPAMELMPDGTWSGNYRLFFPAGSVGPEFTLRMENDRWEERIFRDTSALFVDDNAIVTFATNLNPQAFTLRLVGNGTVWEASEQTGNSGAGMEEQGLDNTAVRVILRGGDLLADSGYVRFNGTNVWVRFRSGALLRQLRIAEANIAECDPGAPVNILPDTRRAIRFGGSTEGIIDPQSSIESDPIPFHIQKNKSYAITYLLAHPGWSAPIRWQVWSSGAATDHAYVIRNASTTNLNQAIWGGISTPTNVIPVLESVRAGHPPEGIYRSRIFDTHVAQPGYRTFAWTAQTPSGSGLEFRIRAGSQPDLSDALSWNLAPTPINGAQLYIAGRYAQVQARLTPGGTNATVTPVLQNFTLRWETETRIVDIGGVFSTGPDHGIFELLVDGRPLVRAVTVDLSVFKDIPTGGGKKRRITASAFAEIVPRNTRNWAGE